MRLFRILSKKRKGNAMAKKVKNDKIDYIFLVICYGLLLFLALGFGIFMHHSLIKTDEVANRVEKYLQANDKNYQDYFENWLKRDQAQKEAEKWKHIK